MATRDISGLHVRLYWSDGRMHSIYEKHGHCSEFNNVLASELPNLTLSSNYSSLF